MDIREQDKAAEAAEAGRTQERKPAPWWWLGQHDPIARFTKWLALYTFLLVVATIGNAIVLYKTDLTLIEQANTTRQQLSVMQEQLGVMQADQRPWIDGHPSISGDLDLSEDPGLPLQIRLRNTGRTPALYSEVAAKMVALEPPVGEGASEVDVLEHGFGQFAPGIKDFCAQRGRAGGTTIFPGDVSTPFPAFARLGKEELAKARANKKGSDIVIAVVVVCVRYESGSRTPHRTVRVYFLTNTGCFICSFTNRDKRVIARNLKLDSLASRDRWDIAE